LGDALGGGGETSGLVEARSIDGDGDISTTAVVAIRSIVGRFFR